MKEFSKLSIIYIGHERKLGGASLCLITMAKEMKERGHSVSVVLPFRGCPVAKALIKEGIKVHYVFFGWWMKPLYWGRIMSLCFCALYEMEWVAVRRLEKIIKKEKPDIIHSNSSVIDVGCRVALKCDVPHVWHFREFGDKDYRLTFISGREKSVQFINSSQSDNIFISESLRKYYSELSETKKNRVIYDGVSEKYCNYIKENKKNSRLVFLVAGNFQKNKRQDVVAEAVKILKKRKINNYRVLMAGGIASTTDSKRYAKKLKKYIEREALDCIEIIGYVEDMNSLRRKVDVEIVPSAMEAFGRVTVEAMLSGNPVLASDTGANQELIKANATGWFFREGDAKELAGKMEYIIRNQGMVSIMGERAYREAKEKYLSRRNTEEIEHLYFTIVNGKK